MTMNTRRSFFQTVSGLLAGAWLTRARAGEHGSHPTPPAGAREPATRNEPGTTPAENPVGGHAPVVTPDGRTLEYRLVDGVKEFHLVAEEIDHEFAPGLRGKCWGYNGSTPGPTIEAVEGDRVRILVTNRLPEYTSIHWHGILLPNGMDGVGGLTQPHIQPGETYAYEFTLRQHGTYMYHPHADEMVQLAVGMMGMFIIHPREPVGPRVDRDFAILLHAWAMHPGTRRPDPSVMTDFSLWTYNSRIFPATAALPVRLGERVRIRIGNLSMHDHPIHLHGFVFTITGTSGGRIPESARWPEVTVNVPVGSTRDIEFVADAPGDWPIHCHKSHHTMNQMAHDIPNNLGVDQRGVEEKIRKLLPGYMAMGETGMAEHGMHLAHGMPGPPNTLPMMMGQGPYGPIEMGGMFTIVKVRESLEDGAADGWYEPPPGTVARRWRKAT
jgi:FtsP/CotA-like multicopper oxidase with cupredoxin domain